MLADEPTAALDHASGTLVLDLLRRIATYQGRAVVLVTHDPRTLGYADRIVHLEDGRLRTAGKQDVRRQEFRRQGCEVGAPLRGAPTRIDSSMHALKGAS